MCRIDFVRTLMMRFSWLVLVAIGTMLLAGLAVPPGRPDQVKLQRAWLRTSGVVIESMAAGGPDLLASVVIDRRDVVRHAGKRSWSDAELELATQRVEIQDLATGRLLHIIRLPEVTVSPRLPEGDAELIRVRFSPDGRLLAVSYLSQIRVYAVGTWREMKTIGLASEAAAEPAPSPRPKLLRPEAAKPAVADVPAPYSYDSDGRTRVVDFTFTADSRQLLAAYTHAGCFYMGAFGLDCLSSGDDPVRLWDVASGKLIWQQSYDQERTRGKTAFDRSHSVMTGLAASPVGNVFAAMEEGPGLPHVVIRSLLSGDSLYSIKNTSDNVDFSEVAFAQDGSSFFVQWPEPVGPKWSREQKREIARNGRRLAKFRTSDGAEECTFPDLDGGVMAVFHHDSWVAAPSRDFTGVRIADVGTCRSIASVPVALGNWWNRHLVQAIRISPDDRWLAVANLQDGWIAVYQVQW